MIGSHANREPRCHRAALLSLKLWVRGKVSAFGFHAWRGAAIFTLAFFATGCIGDSNKVKTSEVRGQVMVDGKPAGHARLVFHPLGGDERLKKLTPRATTDKDGYYELKTYWSGDGAPLGEYSVTALWRGPLPANADSEDFNMSAYDEKPDLLKGKYDDPAKTPLRMTVHGPGELPPLELTTK